MDAAGKDDELVFYVAIDKDGFPALHADLMRFRKGPKRVQRLRVLALQGLFFEAGNRPAQPLPVRARPSEAGAIFDSPADE